jgi:hypothetical protein
MNKATKKQSKTERQAITSQRMIERMAKEEAEQAAPNTVKAEDQKPVAENKVEDQKPASAEDQKPAPANGETPPKKPKKISAQVANWKAQKAFPLTAKITKVLKECPKRKDAARRFSFYKEGQTVGEYIKVAKENEITGALAMADVRWDHVAGFIHVVE